MYIYIHTNRRNTSSQFLGIDSSVLQLAALFGHEVSLEYINVSVHPLYWLRENTEDIPGMKARARAGARDGGGGGREGGNRYSRRRGFRCTMQAEAYIVIIIISPLDIKDLSFSLFASLSLLLLFPWPLTDPLLSLSLFLPTLSLTRVSLPGYQRFLPRSFLPSSTACFSPNDPVPRVALGFREMTICKLLRRRLSLTTIPGRWRWKRRRKPSILDGTMRERERCPRNLWIRTWLFIV